MKIVHKREALQEKEGKVQVSSLKTKSLNLAERQIVETKIIYKFLNNQAHIIHMENNQQKIKEEKSLNYQEVLVKKTQTNHMMKIIKIAMNKK